MGEKQNKRLKEARKALGLLSKEAAERLGLSTGAYSDIENGRNQISSKVSIQLVTDLGINLNWLLTGEGEMFLSELESIDGNYQVEADSFKTYTKADVKTFRKVIIPGIEGKARTFEVVNDCMVPLLNYGDWVSCHQVEQMQQLEAGRVFVVVTKKSEVLIGYGQSYKEGVKVVPHNQICPWQVIPYSQVFEVWQVKVRLTKYFMMPYLAGEVGGLQANEPPSEQYK